MESILKGGCGFPPSEFAGEIYLGMHSSICFDFAAKYFASLEVGMIPTLCSRNISPEKYNKIIKTNRSVHIYFPVSLCGN